MPKRRLALRISEHAFNKMLAYSLVYAYLSGKENEIAGLLYMNNLGVIDDVSILKLKYSTTVYAGFEFPGKEELVNTEGLHACGLWHYHGKWDVTLTPGDFEMFQRPIFVNVTAKNPYAELVKEQPEVEKSDTFYKIYIPGSGVLEIES